MTSQILDAFHRVRRERGDRVAIYGLSEDCALTFAHVWRDAEAVARIASRALVPPGRVVVSVIGNRTAFVSTFLACLRQGAILVPLDGDSTLPEALALVDRFQAAALIVRPQVTCDRVHERTELPNGLSLLTFAHGEAKTDGFADAALFKLTSGSTSDPKAVMASESNLVSDGRQVAEAMDIRPDDVNVAAIPLAHSYGLGNLVMPLLLQGSAIVLRDAFAPARLFDDISQCRATVMPGVPFMFDYIRRHLAGTFPSSMRALISAGARIDAETLADFQRAFALKIHSFYGTSETGGIAYDASDEVADPVTLGQRLPGVQVSFHDAAGAAEGEGRLHVRSAAVTRGYAGDPDSTRESFVDGGYLTGDLGYEDGSGRLFLTGRVSRFINIAGRKVHPDEVARVLRAYPGVSDARVFGIADPSRGQALVACLVADPDRVDTVRLRQHCAAHLSPYKIPRQMIVLRALPVDARGKTDHRRLEELVARSSDESLP